MFIPFKILFILIFFSWFASAQNSSENDLSRQSHCLALDRDFNFNPTSYKNYINAYLHHLQSCDPPAKEKYIFYHRLLSKINSNGLSSEKLEWIDYIIQFILNNTPDPDLSALEQDVQTNDLETFDTATEKHQVFLNPTEFVSYNFKQPPQLQKSIKKVLQTRLITTFFTTTFSSSFLICQNTEDMEHVLQPLSSWLKQSINNFLQYNSSYQPVVFHYLHQLQRVASPNNQNTPLYVPWYQINAKYLKILIELINGNNSSLHYSQNNQELLKFLLLWIQINDHIDEKVTSHCIQNQVFLNEKLKEVHILTELEDSPTIDREKRIQILLSVKNSIEQKQQADSLFFHHNMDPSAHRLYVYFIRL